MALSPIHILALDVTTTHAGLQVERLPDDLLLQGAEEFNALSKDPTNAAGQTEYLRARSATYLAALEFRRAFVALKEAVQGSPCECPDCIRKRGGDANG